MQYLRGIGPGAAAAWFCRTHRPSPGGAHLPARFLSSTGFSAPLGQRSVLAVRPNIERRGGPVTGSRALRHLRTPVGGDAGLLRMSPCGSTPVNEASYSV
jgi:hypothetical protein